MLRKLRETRRYVALSGERSLIRKSKGKYCATETDRKLKRCSKNRRKCCFEAFDRERCATETEKTPAKRSKIKGAALKTDGNLTLYHRKNSQNSKAWYKCRFTCVWTAFEATGSPKMLRNPLTTAKRIRYSFATLASTRKVDFHRVLS